MKTEEKIGAATPNYNLTAVNKPGDYESTQDSPEMPLSKKQLNVLNNKGAFLDDDPRNSYQETPFIQQNRSRLRTNTKLSKTV